MCQQRCLEVIALQCLLAHHVRYNAAANAPVAVAPGNTRTSIYAELHAHGRRYIVGRGRPSMLHQQRCYLSYIPSINSRAQLHDPVH